MPQRRSPAGRPSRTSAWRPQLSDRFIPPQFTCSVEPARDHVVVRPEGELDMATAPELDGQISELHGSGFGHVVVDLAGLTFMDSSGLRLLLQHSKAAENNGKRFSLLPGEQVVERVFDVAGVRSEFRFADRSSLRDR